MRNRIMDDAAHPDVTRSKDADAAPFPPTNDPGSGLFFASGQLEAPERIGPYEVIESLGEGGFGIVYLAQQTEPVKRQVAVKIIKPGMDSHEILTRFGAERQALAMMNHAGIASILDAGATERGRPYFVMEYVRGAPITTYCNRNQLSVRDRLSLFIKVCEAVQHAHERGVLHRDLKPANILVTDEGGDATPRIIDFGVAKALNQPLTDEAIHTRQHQLIGTLEYMAPEQTGVDSRDVDVRADIYALGVILYEMLTGTLPFDRNAMRSKSLADIQQMICEIEPPPAGKRVTTLAAAEADAVARQRATRLDALRKELRGELEYIPAKAMRKDRTRRYRSAIDFADDVRAYLDGRAISAHPESRTYLAKKFVRRHRKGVAISVIMAALLAGSAVVSLGLWMTANRESSIAERRAMVLDAIVETLTESGVAGRDNLDDRLRTITEDILPMLENDPVGEAHVRLRIGRALYQSGDLDASEAQLSVARDLYATHLGDDSLEYEEALFRLATLHDKVGRYTKAIELFEACIGIVDQHPESTPIRRAQVLAGLGLAQLHADLPVARETLETSFRISVEEGRPEVAGHSMVQLAELDRRAGEYDAALDRLQRVLDAWSDAYGPEDARLGSVHRRMALVHAAMEQHDDAVAQIKLARERQATLDRTHPRVASTNITAGMIYLAAADDDADPTTLAAHLRAAELALDEGLRIYELRYGPRHHFVAGALLSWGELRRRLGDTDAALDAHRRALKIYESRTGRLATAIAQGQLGESLVAAGDTAKAEKLLLDSYATLSELAPARARRIAGAMATLCESENRDDDAATWRAIAAGESPGTE